MTFKVKAQPWFKQEYVLNYKTHPDIIDHLKDSIASSTISHVPILSQSI